MIETVKIILAKILNEQGIDKTVTDESDIVNDLGLDSIMMINFMLKIEEEYNINIDYDNFNLEVLSSLKRFTSYLEEIKTNSRSITAV